MFLGNGLVARNAGQKPRKASKAASRAESLGRGLWPAGKGTLGWKLCLQVALAPGKGAELWCSCRAGHWLRCWEGLGTVAMLLALTDAGAGCGN